MQPNCWGWRMISSNVDVLRGDFLTTSRAWTLTGALFCIALLAPYSAVAATSQSFPERPVRLVVPYAAGGPTDGLARGIAQELNRRWGQQVIVDLRPGANSIIGSQIVSSATPDGYTLLFALSAFAINPSIYKNLPYDAVRDFIPVTQVASTAYLLLTNAQVPAKSVADLIKYAKDNAGKLSFGSGGTGSPTHLGMVLFKEQAKVDMTHVPYKGGAPALVDLVSGQIQLLLNPALSSMALVKSGRLKALAVTGSRRSRSFPETPTVAESGLSSYEVVSWYGMFAPGRTSVALVEEIAAGVKWALSQSGLRARLAEADAEPVASTPQEFAGFVASEIKRWGEIVRIAGAGKSIE